MAHIDTSPAPADVQRILAGIIQVAGGKFENKLSLFKAYYWAHVFHWSKFNKMLTRDHRMVRMPMGPGIDNHRELLGVMDGKSLRVERRTWPDGEGSQYIFHLTEPVELEADEVESIRAGIDQVRGKLTEIVSRESHGAAWQEASDGQSLDIYLDAIPAEELARLKRRTRSIRRDIAAIFGE